MIRPRRRNEEGVGDRGNPKRMMGLWKCGGRALSGALHMGEGKEDLDWVEFRRLSNKCDGVSGLKFGGSIS